MRGGRRMDRGRNRIAAIVGLGGLALAAVACAEEARVPPELLGHWTSNNRDYRGRAMDFLEKAVVFQGTDSFTVHPISRLRSSREDESSRTRYEMVYSDRGRPMNATLYFSDRGDLVFENQRGIRWRRTQLTGSAGGVSEEPSGRVSPGPAERISGGAR